MLEAEDPSLIGGQGLRRSTSFSTNLVDSWVLSEVSVNVRRGVVAKLAGARPSSMSSRYMVAMLASLRLCLDVNEPHVISVGGVSLSVQKMLDSAGRVEHCWPMLKRVCSNGDTSSRCCLFATSSSCSFIFTWLLAVM